MIEVLQSVEKKTPTISGLRDGGAAFLKNMAILHASIAAVLEEPVQKTPHKKSLCVRKFLLGDYTPRVRRIGDTVFGDISPLTLQKCDYGLYQWLRKTYRYDGKIDWFAILLFVFPEDMRMRFRHRKGHDFRTFHQSSRHISLEDLLPDDMSIGDRGILDPNARTPEEILIAHQEEVSHISRMQFLHDAIRTLPPEEQVIIDQFYEEKEVDPQLLASIFTKLKEMSAE